METKSAPNQLPQQRDDSGSRDVARPASSRLASGRLIARNTAVQSAGMGASRLASLVFYAVMARTLGKEAFGDFNFALSIGIFVTLSSLGTQYVVTREIARDPERVHHLFWNSIAIRLVLGAIGVAVAVAVVEVTDYSATVRMAVAILAVATWIDVLTQTVQAVFRGLEDMGPIGMSWTLQRLFTAGVGSALLLLGAGLIVATLTYLGGSAFALVYISYRLVVRGVRPRLDLAWPRTRTLLVASIPLAIGNIFTMVLSRVDIIILSFMKSNAAVGIYGAAYALFGGILFLPTMFGLSSYPALSRLGRDTKPTIQEAYEKGCKAAMVALVPVGAVMILFAQRLTVFVYGSNFAQGDVPLRLLGASVPLYGLFLFSTFALAAWDRQRLVAVAMVVGGVVNVALNLLLIPGHSYDGAAAAMTISMIVVDLVVLAMVAAVIGDLGVGSAARVALGSVAGAGAMAAVVFAFGSGLAVIPVALAAYGVVVLVIERYLFPDDFAFLVRSVRGRFPVRA